MHINELPDLVISRIFDCICNDAENTYSSYGRFQKWRVKLLILSVCRAWRQIALSIAHKRSFVRVMSVGSQENLRSSDEQKRLQTENFVVKSNMDIIGNVADKLCITNIELIISISQNPVLAIIRILEKVQQHRIYLEKVRTMELVIVSAFEANRLFNRPSDIEEARQMGIQLAQLIPSIQSIKWQKGGNAPVVLAFVKSVVESYAYQLSEFYLPHMALEDVNNFSDKLESMHIYGNWGVSRNPSHIPAESIKFLSMDYIACNFDWNVFLSSSRTSSKTPKPLVFENLKNVQLRVEKDAINIYGEDNTLEYNKRFYDYKLIAPNLESITILVCPYTLLFLASVEQPFTIRHINLEMKTSAFSFKNFNLANAKKVLTKYGDKDDYKTDLDYQYTLLNDLLNISGLAEYTKAVIGRSYIPVNVSKIDWKYLNEAWFCEPLKDNQLELLVTKHPNLKVM